MSRPFSAKRGRWRGAQESADGSFAATSVQYDSWSGGRTIHRSALRVSSLTLVMVDKMDGRRVSVSPLDKMSVVTFVQSG
jgi:hypothetical protein